MFKFLMVFCFLPVCWAQAEVLPGVWKGSGDLSSSRYGKFTKIPVEWKITQGDDVLALQECWKIKASGSGSVVCSKLSYSLKDGKLFLANGTYVGALAANKIELNYGVGDQSVFLLAGISPAGKFTFSGSQKNKKTKVSWASNAANLTR